ncbi:hypothetical protein DM860_016709 [Cuscuta australis]|uniref:Uncharacterized protein n=1 Tax=Cuscuta australis TaxID=267555 RepID=A0A328DL96_9ASTE|nr:hypothetical protein DM860_016709 [Cuscuta australis]
MKTTSDQFGSLLHWDQIRLSVQISFLVHILNAAFSSQLPLDQIATSTSTTITLSSMDLEGNLTSSNRIRTLVLRYDLVKNGFRLGLWIMPNNLEKK